MGYSGLSSWNDSDMAADLASSAIDAMVKVLNKGLKHKASNFNTDGAINVALFFESFVLKNKGFMNSYNTPLILLAEKALKKMEKEVEDSKAVPPDDWGGASNKKMHVAAYKRMVKNLKKFIEESR